MLNVSMRSLAVFCAVAELRSFVGAADRLDISQPSVSDHIRLLEKRLGSVLFERKRGRQPVLTEAGKALLEQAHSMLASLGKLESDAQRYSREAQRSVRLACQRLIVTSLMPGELARFAREHPQTDLALRAGTIDEVVAQVMAGLVHLGLLLARQVPPGPEARLIGQEKFVFVASPTHALAWRQGFDPAELSRHPFIHTAEGSFYGESIQEMLAEIGIHHLPVSSRATESSLRKELAIQGVGVLYAPERSLAGELSSGALVVLKVNAPVMRMPIWLLQAPGRPLGKPASILAGFLGGLSAGEK